MRKLVSNLVTASTFVVAACLAAATPAAAQSFPSKPVRVIVPYPPGGVTDIVLRLVARTVETEKLLPQPMAIVNVPAGAGAVGSRQAKDSDPDGHTLLGMHVGMLISAALGRTDFGPEAFETVAETGSGCMMSAVTKDSPYRSLKDLLDAARAKPGELPEANAIGGAVHLASLLLNDAAGTQMRYVQVGGGPDRFKSILGGHTAATLFATAEYMQFRDSVRALALLAPTRNAAFPDVPTAKELGYDVTFCVDTWWFAPKGTPADRVATLAEALRKAMALPAMQQELVSRTQDPTFVAGAALRSKIDRQYEDVRRITTKYKVQ